MLSLNGDGYDDFIYVNDNGDVDAWINRGPPWDELDTAFESIGKIAGGVGATPDNARLPDIDGKYAIVGLRP